jgi:hypothetical protein
MNRFTLLQGLIEEHRYQNFLEIGTHKGKTFFPLECKNKTAVDPNFKISIPFLIKWLYKKPSNFRNRYFSMTSDAFFKQKSSYLKENGGLDLVFIDGLHTFEASLKDVLNALKYLAPKGTIVLHDCFPSTKASATPAVSLKEAAKMNIPDWEGSWCGDVWKTIVYLRKHYTDVLDIKVLNTDLGLGLIRLKGINTPDIDILTEWFNQVNTLTYEELYNDPENLIGLEDVEFFKQSENKI